MSSAATKSNTKSSVGAEPTNPFLATLEADISNIQAALSGTRQRVNSAEARYTLNELDALTRSIAIAASERYAESMKVARRSSKGESDLEEVELKKDAVIEKEADAKAGGGIREETGVEAGKGAVGRGKESEEVEKGNGEGGLIAESNVLKKTAPDEVKDASPKPSVRSLVATCSNVTDILPQRPRTKSSAPASPAVSPRSESTTTKG